MTRSFLPLDDQLPRLLAVVGPTAAGKGALAREVATRLGREVFVCDSVKVYRGLDIGSAKPTRASQEQVQHRLIDLVDPDQPFSAGDYAAAAWALAPAQRGVFAGGTGFYLRALAWSHSGSVDGAGDPTVDDPARRAFEGTWTQRERESPGAIHHELRQRDLPTAREIHPANLPRALRALWLCELHGRAISAVRAEDPPQRRCRLLLVVLDPGRDVLAARIEQRVDDMLARGWLAEVENLCARGYHAGHKAMQTLGYRQLLEVVHGRADLRCVRDEIIVATRQYARRQRTYFRRQFCDDLVLPISHPEQCPWDRIEAFIAGEESAP